MILFINIYITYVVNARYLHKRLTISNEARPLGIPKKATDVPVSKDYVELTGLISSMVNILVS